MKNQYFGDVNDYRKYGLLRLLQARLTGALLVAWMLTPDDGSRDGGKRGYLQDPGSWRRYDPALFDGLVAASAYPEPGLPLFERSQLLPRARYHSEVVPRERAARDAWRRGLLDAAAGVDLVFFDPDNGIEVPSCPVGRKDSTKRVTWDEIEGVWELGCSVLIYQHFRHEYREPFVLALAGKLHQRTAAYRIEALKTSHVLFLLAVQSRHQRQLHEGALAVAGQWRGQIELITLSGSQS